jgi:predicted secreted protein with PEFG-CTERM motif
MPEALEGYINFADSVTVKVTSETGQQQILKVVDRNITSTSHALPEFETFSILILIVSIITIIGISRKMSGVFVQLTPNLKK